MVSKKLFDLAETLKGEGRIYETKRDLLVSLLEEFAEQVRGMERNGVPYACIERPAPRLRLVSS